MNKITLILLFFSVTLLNGQSSWKKIDSENYKAKTELEFRKTIPTVFNLYALDTDTFKNEIETSEIISIPVNGEFAAFHINESSPFTNPLASEYGYIKSFSLKGIDDKTATGKISIGVNGVYIIIFSGKHSTLYIDPYTKDKSNYITYQKSDLKNSTDDFSCLVDNEIVSKKTTSNIAKKNTTDGVLRTYRLALACTTEYSDFHLNNQGVSSIETDALKKAAILSAMNTTITRVNGIFERDLGVTMNIVINTNGENDLIFIDSDNLSNGDTNSLIDENQEICDEIIGSDNYDIGHVFSTSTSGGDGLAGLGVVCLNGQKGSGVTGNSSPIGDSFDIDFVAHELGHQFGANHTFNGSAGSCSGLNRNDKTAVEPGSGSTIMAYAGLCGSQQNIQTNSDDYFHAISINQMSDVIQSRSCAIETSTSNTAPIVNAGNDFSVPASTPIILRGEATDNNSDSLTYCWEQIDTEITTSPPLSSSVAGASFRSLPPSDSPDRYLPKLSTVIAGSTENEWEVIPSVSREMNFSLLVRDNNTNASATGRDDMKISVVDTDPFIITSQNSTVNWEVGTTETITWNISTTNQTPINCENVKITLSTDGGVTFPITIAESTPNDGTYDVIVPYQLTSTARIMVEAVDNIFYNINTTDFSIISSGPIFVLSNLSNSQSTCNLSTSSITYDIAVDYINGFSETVNLSINNLPNGTSASLSSTTVNASENVTLTIDNFENITKGNYTLTINGSSTSIENSYIELPVLSVYSNNIDETTLVSPKNNTSNVSTQNLKLEWSNTDFNAALFDLDISLSNSFDDILISEKNLTNNNYTISNNLDWSTTYYWRVKPKNNCGEGDFSDIYNFTTEDEGYCSSFFTNEIGSEYIRNVTFGDINNDSGDANDDPITDGYEDFTHISTSLFSGKTYTVSVDIDAVGAQDHCYVFIDWNNDSLFDTSTERYDLGNLDDSNSTGSTRITVPDDAVLGETRMRVIIEYFFEDEPNGEGPCDSDHNSEFGETEDYTIIIKSDNSLINDTVFENFALYPNPSEGSVQLTFDVRNTEDNISLFLSDITGRIIKSYTFENINTFFNEPINFSPIQTGVYLLNIQNGNKQTTKKLIIR